MPSVAWAPDGRGVVSRDPADESRLLEVALDGGSPRELLRVSDGGDPIASAAWSPSGKRLALSRGRWAADLVLIKGFSLIS